MVTSNQQTKSIKAMLQSVKDDYEEKFNSKLSYRIIVSDYSWATIHAIVETLNCQDINSYSKQVYEYSKLPDFEITDFVKNKTWISSCASHTMHRFVITLKSKIHDKKMKELCCYSFSLLLNCIELESLDDIFKIVIYV